MRLFKPSKKKRLSDWGKKLSELEKEPKEGQYQKKALNYRITELEKQQKDLEFQKVEKKFKNFQINHKNHLSLLQQKIEKLEQHKEPSSNDLTQAFNALKNNYIADKKDLTEKHQKDLQNTKDTSKIRPLKARYTQQIEGLEKDIIELKSFQELYPNNLNQAFKALEYHYEKQKDTLIELIEALGERRQEIKRQKKSEAIQATRKKGEEHSHYLEKKISELREYCEQNKGNLTQVFSVFQEKCKQEGETLKGFMHKSDQSLKAQRDIQEKNTTADKETFGKQLNALYENIKSCYETLDSQLKEEKISFKEPIVSQSNRILDDLNDALVQGSNHQKIPLERNVQQILHLLHPQREHKVATCFGEKAGSSFSFFKPFDERGEPSFYLEDSSDEDAQIITNRP